MPIHRDQLVLWSICALFQVAETATAAPMKPDFRMKAILGFLFSAGRGDRGSVDAYWKALSATLAAGWSDTEARYVRGTNLRTAIEGIMRDVGVDDPLFRHEVHEALHGPMKPYMVHDRMIARLRQERREQADAKAKARDCGWL